MGGNVARVTQVRFTYKILVSISESKISLGRPRDMWEDVIKIDLKRRGFLGVDLIHLAQDTFHWQYLGMKVGNLLKS